MASPRRVVEPVLLVAALSAAAACSSSAGGEGPRDAAIDVVSDAAAVHPDGTVGPTPPDAGPHALDGAFHGDGATSVDAGGGDGGAVDGGGADGASGDAAPPVDGAPTPALPLLGVYEQGSIPNEYAVQAWLGRTIMVGLNGASTATWSSLDDPTWLGPLGGPDGGWPGWTASVPGRQILLSVDMFPAQPDGGAPYTLAACGLGDYDTYWATLAQHFVAWGLENAILRLGHEFNGGWYPWGAWVGSNTPAQYKACFASMVTAMRSVTGQHFTFNWNASAGQTRNVDDAYPGDSYVDSIGVDIYDAWYSNDASSPTAAQQLAVWSQLSGTSYGLAYFAAYAAQHGKPLAIPEWGVVNVAAHGGGDDPTFIQNMHDFLMNPANGVAWHIYFNVHATDGSDHELYAPGATTEFPQSAALFRTLFGAADGGTGDGG